ncbi:MAG: hypothetical protein OXG78_16050 [Chloroflexi bacterium]|nr:hypothetical protein [Chloroflexota bacterium]
MTQLKRLLRPIYAPIVRRHRRWQALRRGQVQIREEVQQAIDAGCSVKVIIGAGQTRYDGWIATDVPAFDVRRREDWARLFPPSSIDRMLAEHVFEHLTTAEFSDFLAAAGRYLSANGRIRIAVPDGNHPDRTYIEGVRPGGIGEGAQDHKALYTCDTISELLRERGYQYELLEYFDDKGRFHQRVWRAEDGFVGRSADHDQRNTAGQLNFTSLIVDCWR